MLSPFCPHLAEELHRELGGDGTVFRAGWPAFDADAARGETAEVAVVVGKKPRGRITVGVDASQDEVLETALAVDNVARHLEGKKIVASDGFVAIYWLVKVWFSQSQPAEATAEGTR